MKIKALLKNLDYLTSPEKAVIEEAYEYAKKAHEGQKRISGEKYITHPVSVAGYLAKLRADADTITAALLHDVVEDTDVTIDDIHETFGSNVSRLVSALTKLPHTTLDSFGRFRRFDSKAESLRQLFQVMETDVRVMLIKLCDRLHNIQSLHHFRFEKQKRIADETLEIYAVVAEKLGLKSIRDQYESYCLSYTKVDQVKQLRKIEKVYLDQSSSLLQTVRKKAASNKVSKYVTDVVSDPLKLNELYHLRLHEKTDYTSLLPFRVTMLCSKVDDCYLALKEIHEMWTSVKGSVVDFISSPAPNGYQALHSTVVIGDGRTVQVQIRTPEMQEYSDFGVAYYCFQKHDTSPSVISWLRHLGHVTRDGETDSSIFMKQLYHDVLGRSIFVAVDHHPEVRLPEYSTVLDAGFYVYKNRAAYISKVYVNGEESPLFRYLSPKDKVSFKFSHKAQVSQQWLDYAETSSSLSFLRGLLKQFSPRQSISLGKSIVQKTLARNSREFLEEMDNQQLLTILEKFQVNSLKDYYTMVSLGKIDPYELIQYLEDTKKSKHSCLLLRVKLEIDDEKKLNKILNLHRSFGISIQKYSIKSRGEIVLVSLDVCCPDKWVERQLYRILKGTLSVRSVRIYNKKDQYILFGMLVAVVLLWGIQPSLVHYAYKALDVTPIELLVTRFWLVVLPFVGWMIALRKKRASIPFFRKEILIGSVALVSIVFFRYSALAEMTPSYHMTLYRNYIPLVFLFGLLSGKIVFHKKYVLGFLFFILASLFFLPLNIEQPGVTFSVIALSAFALYSINTNLFLTAASVRSRYYQYLASIHVVATVVLTLASGISPQRVIELILMHPALLSILSASVTIPYIITCFLYMRDSSHRYTNLAYSFIWMVTVLSDYFLFGYTPELPLYAAGLLMIAGTVLLTSQKRQFDDIGFTRKMTS